MASRWRSAGVLAVVTASLVAVAPPVDGFSSTEESSPVMPRADNYGVFACGYPITYLDARMQSALLGFADAANTVGRIPDWAERCLQSTLPGIIVRKNDIYPGEAHRVRINGETCTFDSSTPADPALTVPFGMGITFPGCLPDGVDPAARQYDVKAEYRSGGRWVSLGTFTFGRGAGDDVSGPPVTGLAATGLYSSDPGVGVMVIDYDRPPEGDSEITITITGDGRTRTITPMSEPVTVSRLVNGATYTVTVVAKTGFLPSRPRTVKARPYSHPAAVKDLQVIDERVGSRASTKVLSFRPGDNRGRVISGYRAVCSSGSSSTKFTSEKRRIPVPGLRTGTHRCVVQARNVGGWGNRRAIEVRVTSPR